MVTTKSDWSVMKKGVLDAGRDAWRVVPRMTFATLFGTFGDQRKSEKQRIAAFGRLTPLIFKIARVIQRLPSGRKTLQVTANYMVMNMSISPAASV